MTGKFWYIWYIRTYDEDSLWKNRKLKSVLRILSQRNHYKHQIWFGKKLNQRERAIRNNRERKKSRKMKWGDVGRKGFKSKIEPIFWRKQFLSIFFFFLFLYLGMMVVWTFYSLHSLRPLYSTSGILKSLNFSPSFSIPSSPSFSFFSFSFFLNFFHFISWTLSLSLDSKPWLLGIDWQKIVCVTKTPINIFFLRRNVTRCWNRFLEEKERERVWKFSI